MVGRITKQTFRLLAVLVLALNTIAVLPLQKAAAVDYTGEVIDLSGDDYITEGAVPIGFDFEFYNTIYTEGYVSTNGSFQFGPSTASSTTTSVPNEEIDNFIAPFWRDLYTNNAQAKSIYYKTVGEPGSRKFILQWSNMAFCCTNNGVFGNFQVILYEGSNVIRFQYFDLVNTEAARGDSAVIGLEKDDTHYHIYDILTNGLLDTPNDALEFTPDGDGGYTDSGHQVTYEPMVLQVDSGLTKPQAVLPADGATGVADESVLFAWKEVTDAEYYVFAISSTEDMQDQLDSTSIDAGYGLSYLSGAELNPNQTYYWQVSAFKDGQFSYSDVFSFTTSSDTGNINPDQPTGLGPVSLIGGDTVDPTMLLSTPFEFTLSDLDSSQQMGYEITISDVGAGAVKIHYLSPLGAQGTRTFAYGEDEGTYLIGSRNTHLDDGATYGVRVRAYDAFSASRSWSSGPTSFQYESTPADNTDGTTVVVEDASPNSGDGNNDGFPDSWQENVSGFVNPVTNNYSVLQVDGEEVGDCENSSASVVSESAQSTQDATFSYPAGLMNFTVTCLTPGATAKITQYFYGNYTGTLVARKYNSVTHTYTDIPSAQIGTTTIGGQSVVKVVYFVTDGGTLDQDGVANGTIVDPSGPAVLASSTTGSAGAPNTGLLYNGLSQPIVKVAVGFSLLFAAVVLRRRQVNR